MTIQRSNQKEANQSTGEEFIQLLTSQQNRLYAFVLSLVGNVDQAEDIVQESNRVAWEHAAHFAPGTNFRAWLFQIAFNQVRAHRRKIQRNRLTFNSEVLDAIAVEAAECRLHDDNNMVALLSCLEKLKPGHEEILRQRYFSGLPVFEIATRIGRTAGSVSVTLHRIRLALMKCVETASAK